MAFSNHLSDVAATGLLLWNSTCSVLLVLEAWFFSMVGLGGFSNCGLAVTWLPRLTCIKDLVQVCM
ncbi:unnamed protein product [Brassica rapa]|uniref:Uncharacterized protein n=2 Tax=Brassica TaxID=3705 RepID=A0A8D9GJA0_BRACM|nr:unnamed protein product [Brassica napus]CAG7881524.1 unnamed protein product [Brassica rapa]